MIQLGIQKEAVHSVSHFEGQDISSKQKKDESGTFNHMATPNIKATVKGHEANSISYFVLEIKRNLPCTRGTIVKLLISHSWYSLVDEEDQSSGLFVVLNISSWSVGSTIPSAAAVGLTAMVSIIIPGRSAIVLPLLLMSPLLVVVLVLLRGPG